MTQAGAVPDLTAAQVQRELFEQSLRGDLAGSVRIGSGQLDELTARIMGNPHLAGWIEAVRVATLRQTIADLESWAVVAGSTTPAEGATGGFSPAQVRQMAADLRWAAARLRDERLGG